MVEDLLELANSDRQNKTQWYLFDNFSFLKEIVWIDENFEEWMKTKEAHLKTWRYHASHLRDHKSTGLLKNLPIPTNPQALRDFLKLLTAKCSAPCPDIRSIDDDLGALDDKKFDMISFDLSADQYLQNRKMLRHLVEKNLAAGGIIALDDVAAVHQGQLLLFLDAVTEMDLAPVAVAGDKVFLQKNSWHASKQDRNAWLTQIYRKRAFSENDGTNFWFYFYENTGEHTHIIKMLPNKTNI